MQLLKRGAEAELYLSEHEGKRALLKKRVKKNYRCEELDTGIRSGRTKSEAKLLKEARKLGVRTPQVYETDRDAKEILMEFGEGKRVKDALNTENFAEICRGIGENIAKMHAFDLIHGDLTTSNILIHNNNELFFIDFGLGNHSKKIENKAVDLLVFRKTFEATHANLMPEGWEEIIKGYLAGMGGEGERVVKHIAAIEKRARYH